MECARIFLTGGERKRIVGQCCSDWPTTGEPGAPGRYLLHLCRWSPRTSMLRSQFVEQRLRLLQVGGVEALGEPVVDLGEHRARLAAFALLC